MASFMIRLSGGALLCVPVMMAQAAGTEQTAHSQKEETLEVVASPFSDDGSTENTGSYTTKQMTTATGLPLSIKDTPQSVSVISRQLIDDLNANSLKEILRWSTGVSESNYDSERSSFNYRGFSVDSYQYDGIPTFFDSGYSGGESEIDSITLDHVEIVRGAAGLLNGVGNPGAAINLVRKKPPAFLLLPVPSFRPVPGITIAPRSMPVPRSMMKVPSGCASLPPVNAATLSWIAIKNAKGRSTGRWKLT